MLALNFQRRAVMHSRNKFFHHDEVKKLSVMAGYSLHNAV
jgi:hypothetical protein